MTGGDPRGRRLALAAIAGSTTLIAVAYAAALLPGDTPHWAAWLIALGTTGVLVSTMALGALRNGRLSPLLIVAFALLALILAGGLLLLLALPPADPADPRLVLGLPVRAAILLYGIGLLPVFIVPVAYALAFDERTLTADDLARVRAAALPRDDA